MSIHDSSRIEVIDRTEPPVRRALVRIGDTIDGRYRIIGDLGEGGMGQVFLAEHVLIQRRVALKVLHAHLAADVTVLERFMNEARAAGTLGHPNIVESTDMGFTRDDIPYIAFEYLQGTALSDEIYRVGGLPVRRALRIAMQIASALEAAHAASIVHRDLKSDNVFLTDRDDVADHVKVLDFGISRFMAMEAERSRPGQLMGTPEFMAPEQVTSPDRVDMRADIYALGVILYEMLCARTPFRSAHDPYAVIHMLLHDEPPALSVPNLPPGLAEMILTKLLAKDPAARYQTMKEVAGALEAFCTILRPTRPDATLPPLPIPKSLEVPPEKAVLLPPAPVKRRRGLGWLVAGLLVGGAGFAVPYAEPYVAPSAPPVSTAELELDAKQIAAALDGATRAAQLRAEAVAATPMLRAAIETDADTLRDMAGDDFVFTPKDGEVLEVFQLRDGGLSSLLRIPASAAAGASPTMNIAPTRTTSRVEARDGHVVVIATAPIATQHAGLGGGLAITAPVDLSAARASLATHTPAAALVGLGTAIDLAGGAPAQAGTQVTIPIVLEEPGARLSLAAVIAAPSVARSWLPLAQLVAWGAGGVLFLLFFAVVIAGGRRNPPGDKPT